MSTQSAGFAERAFEFAFNAEYVERNRAVLAGVPHLPTQNQEKSLGYDVAFELKQRGGCLHTVALQHKVSRFVEGKSPKSSHFWSATCGPYFAFRVDVEQYNLIQAVAAANLPGIEFYYCAPRFVSLKELNDRYQSKTVERESVWIDVSKAGPLQDADTHTITYQADGGAAFLFSKSPVPLPTVGTEERQKRRLARGDLRADGTNELRVYEAIVSVLREQWGEPGRRDVRELGPDNPQRRYWEEFDREPTIANAAGLMAQYFGLSVLVEVPT